MRAGLPSSAGSEARARTSKLAPRFGGTVIHLDRVSIMRSDAIRLDFRSDTVTRPTPQMRAAMAAAKVGDDVLGDDFTVKALEARVAALFGKEAGLLLPTGTMANLAAILS